MQFIFLIFLSLVLSSCFEDAANERFENSYIGEIHKADNGMYYAIGTKGAFLSSVDAENWRLKRVPFSATLLDIDSDNQGRIIIAGEKGLLLSSNDNGESWQRTILPINSDINGIANAGNRLFAVSSAGEILTTEDINNWTSIDTISGNSLTSIYFANNNLGFIGTRSNASDGVSTFRTTNGGQRWQAVVEEDKVYIADFHFFDENIGIRCGSLGIYKTINSGLNWESVYKAEEGFFPVFQKLYFLNDNLGFCIGNFGYNSGIVLKTIDAGNTWQEYARYNKGHFMSGYFFDENKAILSGGWGLRFFRTNDAGLNWQEIKLD